MTAEKTQIFEFNADSTQDGVRQKTLKSSINCAGIALHSGEKVSLTMLPAAPDTGILFRRTDVAGGGAEIPARWDRVVDTRLCTVIANEDGAAVGTVEHLMAALSGCRIDNLVIEVSGPEVPIMDGSAQPFVFLIECAGVVEQDAPRKQLRILKEVRLADNGTAVSLSPGNCFSVGFEINFDDAFVSRQSITLGLVNGTFLGELARARTFGFLHEVETLRAAGLAKGGSLENAIVIAGDGVMNEDGLRYEDEFVRHKALDAVGDLYLAGMPIVGHFEGRCSGHAANNRLLRALFADPEAWVIEDVSSDDGGSHDLAGLWTGHEPGQRRLSA